MTKPTDDIVTHTPEQTLAHYQAVLAEAQMPPCIYCKKEGHWSQDCTEVDWLPHLTSEVAWRIIRALEDQ